MVITGSAGARRSAGRPAAMAWLMHPVTIAALVVLVLNDHLFKAWFPGPLTGKASDVAGLVLTPPVLAVVAALAAPRLRARPAALGAVTVTGLGFAVVKAVPAAATVASGLWSLLVGPSVVRADPTDLVALPALGVALWAAASSDAVSRRTALRRLGVFVVLPAAVVALAATTAPYYPPATDFVTTWQSSLISEQFGTDYLNSLARSDDGGQTWSVLTAAEAAELPSELQTRPLVGATSACVPTAPSVCYRISAGRSQVQESTDGGTSYRVVWELPAWQQRQLAAAHGVGDIGAVAPQSLAIQVRDGQGYVVVLACGRDGYLVGGTAIGQWRRIGFGTVVSTDGQRRDWPPQALPALRIIVRPSDVPLSLLAGALVCIVAGLGTQRRFTSTTRVLVVLLVPAAALCGLCGGANDHDGSPLASATGPSAWLAALAGLAIAANVFIAAFPGRGKGRALATVMAATLGCAALLIGGSTGLLDRDASRGAAIAWTVATAVAGAWLSTRSARTATERAHPERIELASTPPAQSLAERGAAGADQLED